MLRWFARLSIRWKLATVTILTTAVSLLLAGAIMAAYDARIYERQKVESSTAQAELLSASIAASLVFNDQKATHEYLGALNVNREIDAAAAYDVSGKLVAKYERSDANIQPVPEVAGPKGYRFDGEHLTVIVPVIENNAKIGSVYLSASVEPVATRLARYVASLILIASAALAVILPIALRLQRLITDPITELATKNAIIETTLEAVDHGVIVVDSEMRVAFLNERAHSILNLPAGKLEVDMNIETFTRAWQAELGVPASTQEDVYTRLHASEKSRIEFMLPGGRVIELRQSPLPQGGFVRTYTDISEQRALQEKLQHAKEKAEEAATAKSQFLAAMSHEIRTPMNGVVGIVELLKSTRLTDEQRQMVEIIQRSGITLLDVINDILDYSKIEAGRMTLETTAFSLADVVETTAEITTAHAQSKALDISCTVDPDIDNVVQGDPVRIRQIILNIMGNAVKFTEKGAVSIEITADTITEDRIVVLFEITDSGIGISLKKQKALFQAFQQADYSTTRRYGGTGLGLSICKNLVELMGGEIGVNSIEGKGSTFWFKIPFERLAPDERTSIFSHHQRHLSGLRVLVHDTIQSRSAVTTYLRALNITVIESKGIAELFDTLRHERASERPIDVAIVRFHISDEHAHTFFQELDRRPYLDGVKFIFVVPHLNASAGRVATKDGVSWSISAPMRRAKFYDLVARVVGRVSQKVKAEEDISDLNFVPPDINEARAAGCLVLVAEDNQTNQFVIRSQLQRLGIAAEFVNDGREAWDILTREQDRYGLVITDCHMPYIDGYKLTGLIRDQELETKRHRLPVIALTANALQGESDICRAAGMDDYLFKPSSLQALDAVLRKWLPSAVDLRRPIAPSAPSHVKSAEVRDAGEAAPIKTNGAVVRGPGQAAPIQATSTKTNGAAGTPIDIEALAGVLAKYNPEYPRKILALFRSTESNTAATLRELVRTRNGAALVNAAHTAKGSAASAHAVKLAKLCAELERSAKHPEWEAIDVLTTKIEHEFEAVINFIDTLG